MTIQVINDAAGIPWAAELLSVANRQQFETQEPLVVWLNDHKEGDYLFSIQNQRKICYADAQVGQIFQN